MQFDGDEDDELLGEDPAALQLCEELGIDVEYEKPLVWVVKIGLQSPLPPRWSEHLTDDLEKYFVDGDTQQSQWESPLLPYIRQVVDIGRLYMENPYQHVINEQMTLLWQQFRDSLGEWHGPYVAEGRQYFVNQALGVSSWEDPRVEAQYLCELQSALIQKLQTAIPPQANSPTAHAQAESGGQEESRPPTPDFAAWNVQASPRYEEETGASRSPRDQQQSPDHSGLAQLRAQLANKLSGVDFRGEAEKERVKMVKTFTDGIHLMYDLLEEERETQLLQMERRKQQQLAVKTSARPPDSPQGNKGPLLTMQLETGDRSPPSPSERNKPKHKKKA
ncbi:unnamed protein product [Amoebophrya sp. A120]|nr:unnamed protein product [Amoebophrya sp. A120]|eukprot:GSA120T00003357001.1